MITKLHAICESLEQPIDLHVIAGQMSDHTGARALLSKPPNVKALSRTATLTPIGSEQHCIKGDARLYSWPKAARNPGQIRKAAPQAEKPHRDHVRQVQGLEAPP